MTRHRSAGGPLSHCVLAAHLVLVAWQERMLVGLHVPDVDQASTSHEERKHRQPPAGDKIREMLRRRAADGRIEREVAVDGSQAGAGCASSQTSSIDMPQPGSALCRKHRRCDTLSSAHACPGYSGDCKHMRSAGSASEIAWKEGIAGGVAVCSTAESGTLVLCRFSGA